MTLEQLRIFIAVAEREHVTQGARDLNLTQSATSAAIAALEARYATQLFDRIGRRIALTQAGRIFLAEAKAVLARAETAETVLSDLAGLKRGALAIAASQTVGNYWLPGFLCHFRARHPGVELALTIGNTETVAAAAREGLADLGFIEGEIDDPALSVEKLAEDELTLVVPPAHPWAERPPASPEDFLTQRWIFRERGSGTRSIAERALATLGVDPKRLDIALELPSNEAVRAAVEAGGGAAVMSELVASAALKAGALAAVDVALPKRAFLLLRRKDRHFTRAAQEFRALIEAETAPRGDETPEG